MVAFELHRISCPMTSALSALSSVHPPALCTHFQSEMPVGAGQKRITRKSMSDCTALSSPAQDFHQRLRPQSSQRGFSPCTERYVRSRHHSRVSGHALTPTPLGLTAASSSTAPTRVLGTLTWAHFGAEFDCCTQGASKADSDLGVSASQTHRGSALPFPSRAVHSAPAAAVSSASSAASPLGPAGPAGWPGGRVRTHAHECARMCVACV